MLSDGRGEVETVAVGVRVSDGARIGAVRVDCRVHLIVGDGLGLEEFAGGGDSACRKPVHGFGAGCSGF